MRLFCAGGGVEIETKKIVGQNNKINMIALYSVHNGDERNHLGTPNQRTVSLSYTPRTT